MGDDRICIHDWTNNWCVTHNQSWYLCEIVKKGLNTTANNVAITGCVHDWTRYIGLKEHFEYCRKCDQKRSE